jgi:hypothetical protein
VYSLAKGLQAIGLVIPLVGLFRAFSEGGFGGPNSRSLAMWELGMLALGALLFLAGTALLRKTD